MYNMHNKKFNGSANKALDPCTGNKVSKCEPAVPNIQNEAIVIRKS